jgi:cytoskeleton protein RodZ
MTDDLGKMLRDTRERLGLTLEEAERATRIRTHHLEAMERNDWQALPSPVQARGFLRNYADFLGLNPDDVLTEFGQATQPARQPLPVAKAKTRPAEESRGEVAVRRPRLISPDLIVVTSVTLVLLALFIWGGSWVMSSLRAQTLSDLGAPAEAEVTAPTPTPTETSTPQPGLPGGLVLEEVTAVPSITPTLPIGPIGALGLRLSVEREAFLKVDVDGREQLRLRARPGDVFDLQGSSRIEVTTGNGGGVRASFNGQDYGLLGVLNEVVVRLYTQDGILTPTGTVAPTATPGPQASETPAPPTAASAAG